VSKKVAQIGKVAEDMGLWGKTVTKAEDLKVGDVFEMIGESFI
jgi:hypothetical protein